MSIQPEDPDHSRADGADSRPATPRWVLVFGIAALVLAGLVVVLLVLGGGPGEHGPGRHIGQTDSGAPGASSPVADREDGAAPVKSAPKPTLTVRRQADWGSESAPVASVTPQLSALLRWDGRV